MTQFLPPNLLALFAARDPIIYLPPVQRLSHEKRTTGYTGVSDYLNYFETGPAPPREKYETKEERLERRRKEKQEQVTYKLEQEIAVWNPAENEKASSDPFKTIFVGRVNYDTTESKLKREFEAYGDIKKIVVVKDKKTSKPRGYAFVEYEHERDMHSAFKHADGKKVDGKRILVDVERGRTVKGWLPRRLGGGLGGTRRGGPDVNVKISGREDPDRDRFRDEKGSRDDRDRRDRRDRDRSKERNGSVDRDRDRRERRRSHDRVARNMDRERERGEREKPRERDKDKDRKRRRSRSRDRNPEEEEDKSTRKRSRSREKKRHRDRSKDKDKKKDKKDKDRDRDRSDRKERKVKTEKTFKEEDDDLNENGSHIRIKEEPMDDYGPYEDGYDYGDHHDSYVKQEEDEV